jgi:hypothetical protein
MDPRRAFTCPAPLGATTEGMESGAPHIRPGASVHALVPGVIRHWTKVQVRRTTRRFSLPAGARRDLRRLASARATSHMHARLSSTYTLKFRLLS